MTNTKTTKRVLGSSVLALFLCFAMLLGTTYAWFTDSVTSANNIITAGNLDVELYYQAEGQDGWTQVTTGTSVFKGTLWEPGHTEVVRLKVVNNGTLALKYQLGVNIVSETGSTNKDGGAFMLSDHIKYGIVDGDESYTRDTAIAAVEGNATPLRNAYSSESVKLNPNEEKTVTMVVYMPETVGNDANYRGEAPSITLGINVFATQTSVEGDSFGSDYDKDAVYYDVLATTNEELIAAIKDSDAKVIAIDGDLTYDWGSQSYGDSQALLMKGKILRGYNGNDSITFAGYGSANPITDVTLIDITVKDETVGDNENSWEHGYLEFVSLNATNVTFDNSIMLDGNSTLIDCSMDNKVNSWYGLWIEGGNTILKNFKFTGTRAVKIHEAYGSEVKSVVIDNCAFVELSEKPGVVIGNVNADTSITITNNKFIGTQEGDQGHYSYESNTSITTFKFICENNIVPTVVDVNNDGILNDGLYKTEGAYYATNTNAFKNGVSSLEDGDELVVYSDVDLGSSILRVEKEATIDMNGQTISGGDPWQCIILKNGASFKNAQIEIRTNVAVIKAFKASSIENITINIKPLDYDRVVTAIAVQSGGYVKAIKNVTIKGATQGIELNGGGAKVDQIENVHIKEVSNGVKEGNPCVGVALQVVDGSIGEIVDSTFIGEDYGVQITYSGNHDVGVKMTNCVIEGGQYAVYAHECDDGAVDSDKTLKFEYDADTVIKGEIEWNFSENIKDNVELIAPKKEQN